MTMADGSAAKTGIKTKELALDGIMSSLEALLGQLENTSHRMLEVKSRLKGRESTPQPCDVEKIAREPDGLMETISDKVDECHSSLSLIRDNLAIIEDV
jgi:hypothetical protein